MLRVSPSFEPPASALHPALAWANPVGGVQNHAAQLTRALGRRGVAQDVITTRPPTAPRRERPGPHARVLRLGPAGGRLRGQHALGAASLAAGLAGAADVVHLHFTIDLALVPAAVAAARLRGLPLVVTIHCSLRHTLEVDDRRTRAIRRRRGAVEHWLVRHADAVVALTPRLRGLLADDGVDPGRVHVIPSGVDPRRFAAAAASPDPLAGLARPRLVCVGRLEPEKDIATLLRAVAALRRPAELVVVGDGSQRAPLERLARELGIADRVRFAGFLAHAEVPAVLAHADILVHPARMEELGTAVVEAMYAGLPVVASDRGGIPVDDGREGLRVAAGEPRAFAAAIDRLLDDPPLAARLGVAAARRAQREHDWDALAGRMLDVYRAIARERRATRRTNARRPPGGRARAPGRRGLSAAEPGQSAAMDGEHRDELLRLIKGSPQPEVDVETAARRMGIGLDEARALVDELIREGSLRQDGERLIVVEPAASQAPDDEPIP